METQTEVLIPDVLLPMQEYKWRDSRGQFHKIDDMETRHLFHVVRMVWDHSMPHEFQTNFLNRYRFPEFYHESYMALTVRLMLPVLFNRRDLEPYMQYWLNHMHECLTERPPEISFVRQIGYYKEKKDGVAT